MRPQRPAAAQRSQRPVAAPAVRERQNRAAERTRARERAVEQRRIERTQRVEQKQQVEQRKQADGRRAAGRNGGPKAADRDGRDGRDRVDRASRLQLTDAQRRDVRQRLVRERRVGDRIARRNLGVVLARGNRVPHRHRRHVHRFTPALIALAPLYAAYSYMWVDDTICVVDPETYEIVDVIPDTVEYASPGAPPVAASGPPRLALALTADQRRCVYEQTPRDVARADVHVDLALGAEVPDRLELHAFPDPSVDCAPALRDFRYIVLENGDVAVIDPADRSVALVLTD